MITLDEAIEILSRPKTMKGTPQDILEAHDMAIIALRQPEIIRCRECIYWHDITPANLKGYQFCHAFRDMMPRDGYCHKAQRREVSE